jgi:hypothetical protein
MAVADALPNVPFADLAGWQTALIFAAAAFLLLGIAWAIVADARQRAPTDESESHREARVRSEEDRHRRKARARARAKRARASRKRNR